MEALHWDLLHWDLLRSPPGPVFCRPRFLDCALSPCIHLSLLLASSIHFLPFSVSPQLFIHSHPARLQVWSSGHFGQQPRTFLTACSASILFKVERLELRSLWGIFISRRSHFWYDYFHGGGVQPYSYRDVESRLVRIWFLGRSLHLESCSQVPVL